MGRVRNLAPQWEVDVSLTEQQAERYKRNIMLEEVGVAGQERLLASRVLIIGTGGLGSAAALYLAATGAGMRSNSIFREFIS